MLYYLQEVINVEELEQKLKNLIIEKYGSLKKFSEISDIPWSTLDSVLKRGVNNANVSNIIKICKNLDISADKLSNGLIVYNSELKESFPPDIRAAARGMMDLSDDDKSLAIKMIQSLSKKGREAKKNGNT